MCEKFIKDYRNNSNRDKDDAKNYVTKHRSIYKLFTNPDNYFLATAGVLTLDEVNHGALARLIDFNAAAKFVSERFALGLLA
jgi:hypothetical protein